MIHDKKVKIIVFFISLIDTTEIDIPPTEVVKLVCRKYFILEKMQTIYSCPSRDSNPWPREWYADTLLSSPVKPKIRATCIHPLFRI